MLKLKRGSVEWLCATALMMAMTVILSSFSIPVPGGHLYLCDVAICAAALLLDPLAAFLAGGVGAFLGDVLFYPASMFVSLISHGLQAVLIALIARGPLPQKELLRKILGLMAGSAVMVLGYTLGRCYVYATPEYAVIKLPFEILQAAIGAGAGLLITESKPLRLTLGKVFPGAGAGRSRQHHS